MHAFVHILCIYKYGIIQSAAFHNMLSYLRWIRYECTPNSFVCLFLFYQHRSIPIFTFEYPLKDEKLNPNKLFELASRFSWIANTHLFSFLARLYFSVAWIAQSGYLRSSQISITKIQETITTKSSSSTLIVYYLAPIPTELMLGKKTCCKV